jgi:uncharacterized protein with PIN domain
MTVELIIALACSIVVIVFILVNVTFFHMRCPKCLERDSLIETGTTKQERWYSLTRFEYRCKHCGHVVWKLTSYNAAE